MNANFPPYSYVPGGPWPHPIREPGGHMHGERPSSPPRIADEAAGDSETFRWGASLFNRGYYWEAHEVWEGLWMAHGRSGPTADLLKALIKLAAAGVKVREGQPSGVRTHAARASELIESVERRVGLRWLGLDLTELRGFAERVAETTTTATPPLSAAAVVVFDFEIEPKAGA